MQLYKVTEKMYINLESIDSIINYTVHMRNGEIIQLTADCIKTLIIRLRDWGDITNQ